MKIQILDDIARLVAQSNEASSYISKSVNNEYDPEVLRAMKNHIH